MQHACAYVLLPRGDASAGQQGALTRTCIALTDWLTDCVRVMARAMQFACAAVTAVDGDGPARLARANARERCLESKSTDGPAGDASIAPLTQGH